MAGLYRYLGEFRPEPVKMEINRKSDLSALQQEVARSRILQTALEHMNDVGVDERASFSLTFSLTW